ncbi:Ig-like domain-containing protein [Aldersonia sp. NBC_00410]|uniref:L,D-transpeptidase n=1 Tax=Aldersonia sp. NBC_00410 TaxID=2975954 RepID=UPI00224D4979|nr:Ig-like domain-containing protein [Aldersonia sp. NBC_00410]MCX5042852.1 Ig-like domain-containing protein [Aldersonia sp. NBC_00410]
MLGLSACSFGDSAEQSAPAVPIDSNPLTELMKPKLTATVNNGDIGISPSVPVTVTVVDGKLGSVNLTTPDNVPVAGAMAPDGLSWRSTESLGYNRQYQLHAEAFGLSGVAVNDASFTTSVPDNLTKPYLMPGDGAIVGIGQPVAVQFDEAIPDRIAAQNAIKVVTDPPVEGAFYWISSKEVRWRPEHFWAPGTRVDVNVNVYGIDLGQGLYGSEDAHMNFGIGDPVILTADDNTLQVTVERNGVVERTMPTSMGKSDTPTDNGVYIIAERHDRIIMDSSTYGVPVDSPGGYKTPVDYATRMSYNGVFLHSAPWSVGQQGSSDTSHGCLNLSPENAIWVYDNIKRGDIVIVKNTVGGTLSGLDGLGDWNIPWADWRAGNANQS